MSLEATRTRRKRSYMAEELGENHSEGVVTWEGYRRSPQTANRKLQTA